MALHINTRKRALRGTTKDFKYQLITKHYYQKSDPN